MVVCADRRWNCPRYHHYHVRSWLDPHDLGQKVETRTFAFGPTRKQDLGAVGLLVVSGIAVVGEAGLVDAAAAAVVVAVIVANVPLP